MDYKDKIVSVELGLLDLKPYNITSQIKRSIKEDLANRGVGQESIPLNFKYKVTLIDSTYNYIIALLHNGRFLDGEGEYISTSLENTKLKLYFDDGFGSVDVTTF